MAPPIGFVPWNKGKRGYKVVMKVNKKGKHYSIKTEFKKGHIPSHKGKKLSQRAIINLSIAHKGKMMGVDNPLWKGENTGYFAKHSWVKRWRGNPKYCEICGKIGEKIGRRWNLDWANINHKYHRILEDYIGLCRDCHKNYDLKHKLCLK